MTTKRTKPAALIKLTSPTRRRVILPPFRSYRSLEQSYAVQIRKLVVAIVKAARRDIIPAFQFRDGEVRDDDFTDRLRKLLEAIRLLASRLARGSIEHFALQILEKQLHGYDRILVAQVKSNLKIDIAHLLQQHGLEREMELALARNISLITNLTEQVATKIEQSVLVAALEGKSVATLTGELIAIGGFGATRARLIARDQLAKWTGELNRIRQTQLGITSYVWSTSLDERVRGNPSGKYPNAKPSHWAKEGKEFKWADPPKDTGHPGNDYQCRCTARAVIEV